MSLLIRPHLRPLDFQPVSHHGQQMWLLRDPWQLSDRQLIFPQALAQMLLLCDGTRTPEQIQTELAAQLGEAVPLTAVTEALAELDKAYLLFNERFYEQREQRLHDYRAQPYRPPALAGLSYPAAPEALAEEFRHYAQGDDETLVSPWYGRGIVSPHIDYGRGGPVYARVWPRAEPSILQADVVLIFGTDHNGSPGSITLTRQPYATPFGVLPNDLALIDRLAASIGPEAAYAEELNHQHEHSVELSAIWLHAIFQQAGRAPCPVIPILVGSFHHFLHNGAHPADHPPFNRFLAALREGSRGRRVLAVASVDLAHVGPVFGDSFAMDERRRARLAEEDQRLMAAALRGDAADYYQQIWNVRDRNRICGFAPLYLMLRYLESSNGRQIAYAQCPADPTNTSLVSICGLLLD